MIQSDLLGVVFVYGYVALLLVLCEQVLGRYPVVSRKLLHVLTGNIAFMLWVFETWWVMAFIAAAPFIVLTFLMSPYSPVRSLGGRTSNFGHGLGLVYYAVAWTVLAVIFFDHLVVIAVGILTMSYGDGLAGLLGYYYGEKKYAVSGEWKSYVGSAVMLVMTVVVLVIAMLFYRIPLSVSKLGLLAGIAGMVTVVEGVTPRGLDNVSVPFVTVALYWFLVV